MAVGGRTRVVGGVKKKRIGKKVVDGNLIPFSIGKLFWTSWVRLRGPVIQANGRLTFEDDLRSGGLLCFISMNASVRTELADSMVTPGEPGGD